MKIVFILLIVSLLLLSSYTQAEQASEQEEPESAVEQGSPGIAMATAHLGITIIENPENKK